MEHHVLEYSIHEKGESSRLMLDKVVLDRWDMFMEKGHFRYNIDNSKAKVLDGSLGFLAVFLPFRNSLKRPPQNMQFVRQEFEKEKFNFNKIDESKELVCQLVNKDRVFSNLERDIIIINVSPIDRGHCLIVPQVETCLPQILTAYSVLLALEVMKLSTTPHIKMTFSSLRAYASVNHLHLHMFYQKHQFAVQTIPLTPVFNTPYYTFTEKVYPAMGWVWLLREEEVDRMNNMARQVVKLTSWLTDKEVAHNVFMTRGAGEEGGDGLNYVRMIVWARESVNWTKDPREFIMTAAELGGQVAVFEKEKYANILEEEVVTAQKEATQHLFMKLKFNVEKLFKDNT